MADRRPHGLGQDPSCGGSRDGPSFQQIVELRETFADQAVIAIENARPLGEFRARTDELTRSVDELTALGEVGRAGSSTLNFETVLQTIVARADHTVSAGGNGRRCT